MLFNFVDCEKGKYGDNCALNCTCQAENTDVCDKVSGNCTCKKGWKGSTCTVDIDECENTTICQANSVCQNTNGSYSCNCDNGYSLAAGKCVGMFFLLVTSFKLFKILLIIDSIMLKMMSLINLIVLCLISRL